MASRPGTDDGRGDVLSRLAAVDPVPDEGALPGPSSLRGRQLFERIVATDPTGGRARASRWRRRGLPLAAVAAAAGLAAGTWAVFREPQVQTTVACYAAPSTRADVAVVAPGSGDPVASCAELWRDGTFGTTGSSDLRACVLATGALAVFPTGRCDEVVDPDTAASGGPAEVAPRGVDADAPGVVDAVRDVLVDAVAGRPCPPVEPTVEQWSAIVAAGPLSHWEVVRADPDGRGACATLAVDEPNRRFLVVTGDPPSVADDPIARVSLGLSRLLDEEGCVGSRRLAAAARELLDDAGAGDVRVEVAPGFDRDRPCAQFIFDGDDPRLVLLPYPPGVEP